MWVVESWVVSCVNWALVPSAQQAAAAVLTSSDSSSEESFQTKDAQQDSHCHATLIADSVWQVLKSINACKLL